MGSMTQPQILPVPFYVLCGSLGAGKTTLLMRLLEFWNSQGHKVGVLMNEAGEVSIDGPRAGTIAEQVLNLAGGCICCDTKDDLAWSITQLVQDYQSTVIVLECSGMAAGQTTAFGLLVHGATLAVVGFTMDKVELRLSNLMAFDARAIGNWGCPPELYPGALDLVLDGKVKLAAFVETFPLADINRVFDAVHRREITRRAVLVP